MPPPPVAVCVPARDEEACLPALLAALDRQEGEALAVCFFLDGCTDRSEALLRGATAFRHDLRIASAPRGDAPNAGRARRAAMAMGLAARGPDALLLTTDADSVPADDWVAAAVRALAVADVAAGTLRRAEPHAVQERVEAYYDRLHRYRRLVDPVAWDGADGRHFAGGANFAIRGAVYRALGGFAALASGEDAALIDAASRAGFRVRRDAGMVVETSSRRIGRAPGGLAYALAALDRDGAPMVAHPDAAAWQYRAQGLARAAFGDIARERTRLGAAIGLGGDHVLGVARDCPNAEAFAMRVVPAAPGGERLVPLAEAEAAMARLEQGLVPEAAA